MKKIFYAQNFEDVMLARALADVSNGFYVDVGAQDPVIDSVTRWFYERGWRGINIEPVSHWFERIQEDRPRDTNLMCAVASTPGTLVIHESLDSGLSTASEEYACGHIAAGREMAKRTVPARRLDDIFAEHAPASVHFLKIDVEGMEADVLASLSLTRYRPWILVIEATRPNTDTDVSEAWQASVLGAGYRLVYRDGLNRFYLAEEQMARASAFDLPPNVFDDFIHYREHAGNEYAKSLEVRLQSLHDTAQRLREDLTTMANAAATRQVRIAELDEVIRDRQSLLEETARQAEAWRDDLLTVSATAEARRGRIEELEGRITELQRELGQVYASRSWRLTAPIRGLGRVVRVVIGRILRGAADLPVLRRLGARMLGGRTRERVLRLAGFGRQDGASAASSPAIESVASGAGAAPLSRAAVRVYQLLEQAQGKSLQGTDEDPH